MKCKAKSYHRKWYYLVASASLRLPFRVGCSAGARLASFKDLTGKCLLKKIEKVVWHIYFLVSLTIGCLFICLMVSTSKEAIGETVVNCHD